MVKNIFSAGTMFLIESLHYIVFYIKHTMQITIITTYFPFQWWFKFFIWWLHNGNLLLPYLLKTEEMAIDILNIRVFYLFLPQEVWCYLSLLQKDERTSRALSLKSDARASNRASWTSSTSSLHPRFYLWSLCCWDNKNNDFQYYSSKNLF